MKNYESEIDGLKELIEIGKREAAEAVNRQEETNASMKAMREECDVAITSMKTESWRRSTAGTTRWSL